MRLQRRELASARSLPANAGPRRKEGKLAEEAIKLEFLAKGISIHSHAAKSGNDQEIKVASSLIDMYVKCGSLDDALRAFHRVILPDVICWNAIIMGCAQGGRPELGLEFFSRMQLQGGGVLPDSGTFTAALKACAELGSLEEGTQIGRKLVKLGSLDRGMEIHSQMEKAGEPDVLVANSLLDMYAKCGSMWDARRYFERKMKIHDIVSWNTIIQGCVEDGDAQLALDYFARLREDRVLEASEITLLAALRGCGTLGSLEAGRAIHNELRRTATGNVVLETSLVDFYGKCGSMAEAQQNFDSMARKDTVAWNALIAGYAHQGDSARVFELFYRMEKGRIKADGVTFLSVLNVCSHAGLVLEGKQLFHRMKSSELGITPGPEHFSCMVDLLSRSNRLDDAVEMAEQMPRRSSTTIDAWRTILAACRKWRNLEVGRLAFHSIVRAEERDGAAYVLMANIYAAAGLPEMSASLHALCRRIGAWKKPGQSWWIDSAGKIHSFVAGDSSHPQSEMIRAKLRSLTLEIKEAGYVPELESALRHGDPDDARESALCGHSERLAIGCAILNSPPGTTIRIAKNLRVCDDCHRAITVISRVEAREIVCRDARRFHAFKDGTCSCGGFW